MLTFSAEEWSVLKGNASIIYSNSFKLLLLANKLNIDFYSLLNKFKQF